MATKKQKKKAMKTAKKVAKTKPILVVFLLLLLIGAGVAVIVLFNMGVFDRFFKKTDAQPTGTSGTQLVEPSASGTQQGNPSQSGSLERHHAEDGYTENIIYDNFQIHFMELGNEFAGDSTYIKAGDVDILIDAGSRGNSAPTLNEYIKKYCTDGKLEYVIATHNHQDHIAAFAGNSDSKAKNFKGEKVGKTGVLYYYEVGTIIDFTYAGVSENNKTVTYENKTQVS